MSIAGVSTGSVSAPRADRGEPRLWGADLRALHDRWWACSGVQIVRCNSAGPSPAAAGPRVFLLLGAHDLVRLNIAPILKKMVWLKPRALRVRLVDRDDTSYAERLRVSRDGRVEGVVRAYHPSTRATARAAITNEIALARLWRSASDPYLAWSAIDDAVGPDGSAPAVARALILDARDQAQGASFVKQMVEKWHYPGAAFDGVYEYEPGVWLHESVEVPEDVRFVAPVWIGAQRTLRKGETIVGPGLASDADGASSDPGDIDWPELHSLGASRGRRQFTWRRRGAKRAFDILFSLLVLAGTAPLYPLITLAIFLEDGWPPFFTHRRQTVRGREFPCIKFRTMRRDAESMKTELVKMNQADGPQFFIENDPRVLRVGKVLRKLQLDELPQFINVLLGHMSVVGPRPSPDKENQFCPAWREARLSVRPGVTGLWQVRRTRAPETDFQEWIKYDLEYVQRQSFRLDMWIIWTTVRQILKV
jgi:lipopolysaccharide/colanic/teichoic acid biosynthesis glycosyltransferase